MLHALRSSTLVLPSEIALYDYTHFVKGSVGFYHKINVILVKEAGIKEEKD